VSELYMWKEAVFPPPPLVFWHVFITQNNMELSALYFCWNNPMDYRRVTEEPGPTFAPNQAPSG